MVISFLCATSARANAHGSPPQFSPPSVIKIIFLACVVGIAPKSVATACSSASVRGVEPPIWTEFIPLISVDALWVATGATCVVAEQEPEIEPKYDAVWVLTLYLPFLFFETLFTLFKIGLYGLFPPSCPKTLNPTFVDAGSWAIIAAIEFFAASIQ